MAWIAVPSQPEGEKSSTGHEDEHGAKMANGADIRRGVVPLLKM